MNILRFINSKDIRNHLEKNGYEFSSLEAAWLIYQCKDATIVERHEAWSRLIETMPDCKIEERLNTVPQESLHAFLKRYMDLENKYLDKFFFAETSDPFSDYSPFVFSFEYFYRDGTSYNWNTVFSDTESLYEKRMEPDEDVVYIKCTKMQIDKLNSKKTAYLSPSLDILSIDPGIIENVDEQAIYNGVFSGLWFDFPTPFHKGDIVWDSTRPYDGPFVTTGICLDSIESENVKDNLRKDGDNTDMCAGGYFLEEDGSIYTECMSNYMNLEFYENELIGSQRTLTALSNFIKGEIDPALFARAYHQIITRGYADDSMPRDYLESGLILAGLAKAEQS